MMTWAMRRWRAAAVIVAVLAFGLAGLGLPAWLPAPGLPNAGRTALFWLGVACFLAAAWGRPG